MDNDITQLERAQIIIDTINARVHELEEALLAERTAHALTRLVYQKIEQNASGVVGQRFAEAVDG